MNLRLESSQFVFDMTPAMKEQMISVGKKYGDFRTECSMRYLKISSKECKGLEAMIDAALAMYDYVRNSS